MCVNQAGTAAVYKFSNSHEHQACNRPTVHSRFCSEPFSPLHKSLLGHQPDHAFARALGRPFAPEHVTLIKDVRRRGLAAAGPRISTPSYPRSRAQLLQAVTLKATRTANCLFTETYVIFFTLNAACGEHGCSQRTVRVDDHSKSSQQARTLPREGLPATVYTGVYYKK